MCALYWWARLCVVKDDFVSLFFIVASAWAVIVIYLHQAQEWEPKWNIMQHAVNPEQTVRVYAISKHIKTTQQDNNIHSHHTRRDTVHRCTLYLYSFLVLLHIHLPHDMYARCCACAKTRDRPKSQPKSCAGVRVSFKAALCTHASEIRCGELVVMMNFVWYSIAAYTPHQTETFVVAAQAHVPFHYDSKIIPLNCACILCAERRVPTTFTYLHDSRSGVGHSCAHDVISIMREWSSGWRFWALRARVLRRARITHT